MIFNDLKKFDLETKAKHKSDYICAADECGRGSLCGSFVAACVILPDDYFNKKINDSKKLLESQRTELAEEIKEHAVYYNIVEYSNQEIDSLGIQAINVMAFQQLQKCADEKFHNVIHLVDGTIMENKTRFFSIVKGDAQSFSIACASIIAKDYRDRCMIELAEKYPQWNLQHNKGYGKDYIDHVKLHGFPEIHRKSYHIKEEPQFSLL